MEYSQSIITASHSEIKAKLDILWYRNRLISLIHILQASPDPLSSGDSSNNSIADGEDFYIKNNR